MANGWDGVATVATSKGKQKEAAKHAQTAADLRKSGKRRAARKSDRKARKAISASNELRKRGY